MDKYAGDVRSNAYRSSCKIPVI